MSSPIAEHLTLAAFDFDLPEALIAQEPATQRDRSRLMLLHRETGSIEHRVFADIAEYLLPGDLLVLNDTKVIPCRLPAKKRGGGKAEIFLLREQGPNLWEALVKGASASGTKLTLEQGIVAEIIGEAAEGVKQVRFHNVQDIRETLVDVGRTPLPPYIKREPTAIDLERYQTVYASQGGAVAAPTAGLHFTKELLATISAKGVELAMVTLHVGPGTFQPVRVSDVTEHRMLAEHYEIADAAAAAINRAKAEGRRVIAVGTTSVRTIETAARPDSMVVAGKGSSDLFIVPGYRFKVTNGIVTNFHLPKSTLLMLVSAFAGRGRVLDAYRTAVGEKYRFYSYGDAMCIL